MGKNKNRPFDLAKRQEKILKRMAKPLYKKSDKSMYFVVTQPFGMHPSPPARGTVDVNRLASWISWVFRRESVVEAVYTTSTRDEIVLRIADGADPTRILGKHKYKNILKAGWPYDPSPVSCVFVYNYQSNGDPSNHNWREHVPSEADAPPDHFRNPYPTPTWVVRPSYLSDLTLALPDTLPRSPNRSSEPPTEARGHTRREEAKPEPGGSFHNTDDATSGPNSLSSRVKVEPSGAADSSVTRGEPTYEPSQALRDQIALLAAGQSQASVRVKPEPVFQIKHEPDGSDPIRFRSETYDAPGTSTGGPPLGVKQEPRGVQDQAPVAGLSQALWDEWARYQSNLRKPDDPVTRVNQESYAPESVAQIPITQVPGTAVGSFDLVSRDPLPSIKHEREPTTDEAVQPWKRPKTEIN